MAKAVQTPPTQPIPWEPNDAQPHLTVAATWKDKETGALYVHQDLVKTQEPWAEEAHIAPMKVTEQFGDIESWVAYVLNHGSTESTLLTWNSKGFRAVLDYANRDEGLPGRCQWKAEMPFRSSVQWDAWRMLANGQAMGQKTAIERIEDLSTDIVQPAPSDLMGILRTLRASVNAKADTELRPDGTSKVSFVSDTKVQTAKDLDLPASFTIAIPVLKGHLNADGKPVLYRIEVKVRVSVDDAAHLSLRFSIPTADRILEDVFADRVTAAKGLLGESFDLLRAGD